MSTRLLWALLALSLPLAASAAPEAPTTKTDKVGDKAAEKPAGAPWAAQDSFCKSCNRFTCGIPEIKTVCRSVCQATKVETCAKADFVMPDTHFHDLYQGQFCERGCGNTAHCANKAWIIAVFN